MRLPFIAPVAGVSQYQDAVTRCVEGLRVTVRREPENPYDGNACVVESDGQVLGYLPKALAARLVDSTGTAWDAELVEVLRGETWGLRIRVVQVAEVADEVVVEEELTEVPAGPEVRSGSGRVLGTLVRVQGTDVVVLTPSGYETPYPAGWVSY